MKTYELSWRLGHSPSDSQPPQQWIRAEVPGAVQLDWAREKGWPDPSWDNQPDRYQWMEDCWWWYAAEVDLPEVSDGQALHLHLGGIDYEYQVYLEGQRVCRGEGMFTPVEVDLSSHAGRRAEIEVRIAPAPQLEPVPGRQAYSQCAKPLVSKGWDFHPRLVPLGLWRPAYVALDDEPRLLEAETFQQLSEDHRRASLRLEAKASGPCTLRWTLESPDGKELFQREKQIRRSGKMSAVLKDPQLWWPWDQGRPSLYVSRVELLDDSGLPVQARWQRVGIRTVRLVMSEETQKLPPLLEFPKSRYSPPMTLEINGRRIFARGSNFVSPDIFPARLDRQRYAKLVDLARQAGLNLLRCWGGAVVPTDDFYELCDEAGILVWTEFPLACHRYDGTEKYLAVLDRESRSIISRARRHACNAILCGGNELLNNWSMMTDQDLPLRLLNRNCYDLAPQTPFLPASPVMDVMHGGYQFILPDGRDVFQYGRAGKHIAYCEFGVPGPSPLSRIEKIIPPEQRSLEGLVDDSAWQVRSALQAWDVVRATWLEVDTLGKLFGAPRDLEELLGQGELLQREGLKALFEEYRRQKPYCSMALNWCFSEPWPTAANNSVVAWPDVPKAGYEGLRQANRPVMASGRIEKFSWQGGETFRLEPWILNDLYQPVEPGLLQATLGLGDREIPLGSWPFPQAGENQHIAGREMTCELPKVDADLLTVKLRVQGREEMSSHYTLRYCR